METKMKVNDLIGQSLQIIGRDNIMRTYPIFHAEKINGGMKIYTRFNQRGFRLYENVYWRIQNVKIVSKKENFVCFKNILFIFFNILFIYLLKLIYLKNNKWNKIYFLQI